MISGQHFDDAHIRDLEQKNLIDFYQADNPDPILGDAIGYYSVLFQTYLRENEDRTFSQMSEKDKENILDTENTKFRLAMQYSFNKGHQIAFAILLMDTKVSQKFDKSFFSNPNSKTYFLYNLDTMVSPVVTEENLCRDKNEILIRDTRRHFENGYQKIMYFAKIFYKKGASLAFEQIRKNIVHAQYDIKGTSRLMNIPYNQDVEVTPAFTATFSLESPNFEEWDIHWDATYGYDISNRIIAKFLIHQLSIGEIKEYADQAGAITYHMLQGRFSDKMSTNQVVYVGEVNFSLVTPLKGMRLIEEPEYNAIRTALALTLKRRLQLASDQVLITIG